MNNMTTSILTSHGDIIMIGEEYNKKEKKNN